MAFPRLTRVLVPAGQGVPGTKGDKGDDGADGSPYTVLMTFDGQSNIRQNPAKVWTPPPNLKGEWNWDGVEGHVGTDFAPVDATKKGYSQSVADRYCRRHPNANVYIVRTGFGGMPIRCWDVPLQYKWSTQTAMTNPGNGYVRFNNADPSLATQFMISGVDKLLFSRYGAVWSTYDWFRMEKASDPSVFIEFNPGLGVLVAGGYNVNIDAHISHSGVFAEGDDILITNSPDAYGARRDNQGAAIAKLVTLGITDYTHLDFWWQGESDVLAMWGYIEDFRTMRTKFLADGIISYDTPTVVMGMSEYTGDLGVNGYWTMGNKFVERAAMINPDTTIFIRPSAIPAGYWDAASAYLHMTADGYGLVGGLVNNALSDGARRSNDISASYYPGTTGKEFDPGSVSAPTIRFRDVDGGLYSPGKNRVGWAFSGNLKIEFGNSGIAIGKGSAPTNVFESYKTGTGASDNIAQIINSSEYSTTLVQKIFSNTNSGVSWNSFKSRGDSVTPLVVQLGDTILQMDAQPYGGSGFLFSYRHSIKVIEDSPDMTHMGIEAVWAMNPKGSISNSEAFAFSHESIRYRNRIIVNGDGTIEPLRTTRIMLPTPATNNRGYATLINPESGKWTLVCNDGVDWRYSDNSLVTIS